MKIKNKGQFIRKFRGRFSLRLHMFAILTATACSGVLASKVLLELGLGSLPIRYPLAVLLAYLVFFLCVRLWLIYVTPPKKSGGSHLTDWLDFPDFSAPGSPAGVYPKPFLVTLVMALVAGGILNYYFPGASRVAEILR